MKLDIGCGNAKVAEDFIGIDRARAAHPDLLMDILEFPWPWGDNSVTHIHASHFIEHIPMTCWCCRKERDPLIVFFEECWRVLEPGGEIRLHFPVVTAEPAFQDPTHRRFLSRHTMGYLNQPWRVSRALQQYEIGCDFDIVSDTVLMDDETRKRPDYQAYGHQHFNAIYEARMVLKAVKPCRT